MGNGLKRGPLARSALSGLATGPLTSSGSRNDLLNGLLAYYKFDDIDAGGTTFNAVNPALRSGSSVNGGLSVVNGIIINGVACDGGGDPTQVFTFSDQTALGSVWSLSLWIFPSEFQQVPVSTYALIVGQDTNTGLILTQPDLVTPPTVSITDQLDGTIAGFDVTVSAWHHIGAVYALDGSLSMYHNGVLAAFSGAGGSPNLVNWFAPVWALGDGIDTAPYIGNLDEWGIWKGRALTATNMQQLYNSGAGLPFGSFGA